MTAAFDPAALLGVHTAVVIDILRQIWLQNYMWQDDRLRWRTNDEIPSAAQFIGSPYDVEAHYSRKRTTQCVGYKVRVTETCDEDSPRLITDVTTTLTPHADDDALPPIQAALHAKDLLPDIQFRKVSRVTIGDSGAYPHPFETPHRIRRRYHIRRRAFCIDDVTLEKPMIGLRSIDKNINSQYDLQVNRNLYTNYIMSVRYTLLGLLVQRPRHGYDLHAAFEAVMGGEENWDVKPAQIYSTLARLQESGHIVEEIDGTDGEGADRRVYAITEKGQTDLATWFNTPVTREHQRDEVFAKLMLAIATEVAQPHKVLQIQRAKLYQDLHALTAQRSKVDPQKDLAHILLLDSAVMHIEADLRWLDMVDARLDEIKRQPLPEPEMRPRGRPKKIVEG